MTATWILDPVSRDLARSDESRAYDVVHMNRFSTVWRRTTNGKVPVIVNFDKVTVLDDGGVLISGKAMDEYGWWHRAVTIDTRNVEIIAGWARDVPARDSQPEPAPFPVSIRFEWRHTCIRLVIPDDAARRLREWKSSHWTEIYGMADGYSSAPRRGTWEHKALAFLHAVQSRLDTDGPFIEGVSFETTKDYDVFVSTYGVRVHPSNPTIGFHFSG